MTLTEFLMARIDEDEDAAKPCLPRESYSPPGVWKAYLHEDTGDYVGTRNGNARWTIAEVDVYHAAEHIARHDPARVLAEIEAKRRIVERLQSPDPHLYGEPCNDCATLYDLAAVYADHVDYDQAWRP